jgi:hypothetical protein
MAEGNEYDVDETVRLRGKFDVDPTTVTATVKSPSGTTTSPTVAKDSDMNYHFDVDITEPGEWNARMKGTLGDSTAVRERTFFGRHSRVL